MFRHIILVLDEADTTMDLYGVIHTHLVTNETSLPERFVAIHNIYIPHNTPIFNFNCSIIVVEMIIFQVTDKPSVYNSGSDEIARERNEAKHHLSSTRLANAFTCPRQGWKQ